jgi:hypothetical protein
MTAPNPPFAIWTRRYLAALVENRRRGDRVSDASHQISRVYGLIDRREDRLGAVIMYEVE